MNSIDDKDLKRKAAYLNSEKEIEEYLGENYNNTMSHRMKTNNTFNNIAPCYGLWKSGEVFKTTNNVMKPMFHIDRPVDKTFHFKTDKQKKYAEEVIKARTVIKATKLQELERAKTVKK